MRKPSSTLVLVGPCGHGKTTLAAGLLRASGPAGQRPAAFGEPPGAGIRISLPRSCELSLGLSAAEIETTRRRYTLLDPGDRLAVRKRLVAGPLAGLLLVDGALLVVDSESRYGPELRNDLRLLRRVGIQGLVLFLNRTAPADPELLDLAEHELRLVLCDAGFSGDAVPIVRGCARELRNGEPAGLAAAVALHEARAYEVELSTAVALAPGDGFGLLPDGGLIGVGVVTAVRGTHRKRKRGALLPAGLALAFVDTLNCGDRPDVVASLLFPPEDVLQATFTAYAKDVRPFVQSGTILLRLVADGRTSGLERSTFAVFHYSSLVQRPIRAEYLGLRERQRGRSEPRQLARGQSMPVYLDLGDQRHEMPMYTLGADVAEWSIITPESADTTASALALLDAMCSKRPMRMQAIKPQGRVLNTHGLGMRTTTLMRAAMGHRGRTEAMVRSPGRETSPMAQGSGKFAVRAGGCGDVFKEAPGCPPVRRGRRGSWRGCRCGRPVHLETRGRPPSVARAATVRRAPVARRRRAVEHGPTHGRDACSSWETRPTSRVPDLLRKGRGLLFVGAGVHYQLWRNRYATPSGDLRLDLHGASLPLSVGAVIVLGFGDGEQVQ